jgi:AraC-like DNA-binding protein
MSVSAVQVAERRAADRTSQDGSFRVVWAPQAQLAAHVACVWASRSSSALAGRSPDADPLLPDGAVELVWSGRGLFVRGADTRPHCVGVFPDRTFVAVRFRTGAAADVLGLHGAELADARVGISLLWGRGEMERLESLLAACPSPRAAADILEAAVAARIHRLPDPAVAALVARLRAQRSPVRIAALADWLGFSERQLGRRATAALGYGPKMLDRIFRFQRFRSLAASDPARVLADLAASVGYADQSHLTRECLRLAGETPVIHRARLHASVSFKTRPDSGSIVAASSSRRRTMSR